MDELSKLLKLSELARLYGLPVSAVRYWAKLRKFPIVKLERTIWVDPRDFADWMKERMRHHGLRH